MALLQYETPSPLQMQLANNSATCDSKNLIKFKKLKKQDISALHSLWAVSIPKPLTVSCISWHYLMICFELPASAVRRPTGSPIRDHRSGAATVIFCLSPDHIVRTRQRPPWPSHLTDTGRSVRAGLGRTDMESAVSELLRRGRWHLTRRHPAVTLLLLCHHYGEPLSTGLERSPASVGTQLVSSRGVIAEDTAGLCVR